ncbi:alpha/beta hydrolase [Microbacterium sp.]|uniref:alpha/beta hydrolase n=1 Tax=Microbacterium sp. TaxID=51671 RepID=UPI002898DAC2|nr:alpha/beta hydrolase [Microbacterium sp.]
MDEELAAFAVHPSPETIAPTTEYEGTNASRFALMAPLGPVWEDSQASDGVVVTEHLVQFGLNPELMRTHDFVAGERAGQEAEFFFESYRPGMELTELRYTAFNALNTEARLDARLAFLAAGLGSALERESVTAASAVLTSVPPPEAPSPTAGWRGWPYRFLTRHIDSLRFTDPLLEFVPFPDEDGEAAATVPWDGEAWQRYCSYWLGEVGKDADPASLSAAVRFLAQVRVEIAERSADPIVRELAFASYLNLPGGAAPSPPSAAPAAPAGEAILVSTMVHGTWGWKGAWWYPGGDFHRYVASGIRPALYAGGQEFSWSGAYSTNQRAIGGNRFARWVQAVGGADGLGTVFGHSYGGEIIARAVNAGSTIDEVVFLSAPVHAHHRRMLSAVRRVVDVRLPFDIVLTAARASQKLPPAGNVVEYVVKQNFWSHGATHNPEVWASEGIATAVGL